MYKIGKPPYLECSSKGEWRFSAFFAHIKKLKNKSIEEIYQGSKKFADGTTELPWHKAKGRTPVNIEQCREIYSLLWDVYIEENPDLLEVLKMQSGLSDFYGQKGRACQAEELWRIRNEA